MSTTKNGRVLKKIFSRRKLDKALRILKDAFGPTGNVSDEIQRLEELADAQGPLGDSLVHIAIYSTGRDETRLLQELIKGIEKENLLDIYLTRNNNEFTALDEAIHNKSALKSLLLLQSLRDDEQRLSLLNACNRRGWTALHRAVYENNSELLRRLMQSVDRGVRRELVLKQDKHGTSVIQQALSSPEMFRCLLECCAQADRSRILLSEDKHESTILHNIVLKGNADLLRWAIERTDPPRQEFLRATVAEGKTVLHLAVENGDNRMVRCLVDMVEAQIDRFRMLHQTDARQQTALHYAANVIDDDTRSIMKILLESIRSINQRHVLLQQEDRWGKTVLGEAQRVNNVDAIAVIAKLVNTVDPLLARNPSTTLPGIPNDHPAPPDYTPDVRVVTATQVEESQPTETHGADGGSVSESEINNIPKHSDNKIQSDDEKLKPGLSVEHPDSISEPTIQMSEWSIAASASGGSQVKDQPSLKEDSPSITGQPSTSIEKPGPLTMETPIRPPRPSKSGTQNSGSVTDSTAPVAPVGQRDKPQPLTVTSHHTPSSPRPNQTSDNRPIGTGNPAPLPEQLDISVAKPEPLTATQPQNYGSPPPGPEQADQSSYIKPGMLASTASNKNQILESALQVNIDSTIPPLTANPPSHNEFDQSDEQSLSTHPLRIQPHDSTSHDQTDRSRQSAPEKFGQLTTHNMSGNNTTYSEARKLSANPPGNDELVGASPLEWSSESFLPKLPNQSFDKLRPLSANIPQNQGGQQPSSTKPRGHPKNTKSNNISTKNSLSQAVSGSEVKNIRSPSSEPPIAFTSSGNLDQLKAEATENTSDTLPVLRSDLSAAKPEQLINTQNTQPKLTDQTSGISTASSYQSAANPQPEMTWLKQPHRFDSSEQIGRADPRNVPPTNNDNANNCLTSGLSLNFEINDGAQRRTEESQQEMPLEPTQVSSLSTERDSTDRRETFV